MVHLRFMRKFIRARRENRVRKLDEIIARRTILIDGIDEGLWPWEAQAAREERARAAHERANLLAKLERE